MTDLDELLTGARRVGIAGHVKPDGDAFGSCMGLYLFLKEYYPQIEAAVYLEDSYSKSYTFVSHSDEILHDYPKQEPHDVFFSLDCADPARLGNAGVYFSAAKKQVVIDHHVSNHGFGMINEIQPDSSSTSEIIALMIGKDRISKTIAEPLYMGIVHDTGIFQYSCTSSRTMMVGGWLMDTGIAFSKICDDTFFTKDYHQNQILGRALTESILMLDG
ncbi:MAG: DHH family phosphoesterase, partial [Lachnospiraceae bacterium]|nr:DHH family phosphoesterase [Lachnospiraceae bacterium]